MGATPSKDAERDEGPATVDTSKSFVEVTDNSSSGFHVMEFHGPTIGKALLSVLVIAVLAAAALALWRFIKRRWQRAGRWRGPEGRLSGTGPAYGLRALPPVDEGRFEELAAPPTSPIRVVFRTDTGERTVIQGDEGPGCPRRSTPVNPNIVRDALNRYSP